MKAPAPATLERFIEQEVRAARLARHPCSFMTRFVQLHECRRRNSVEQHEYTVLRAMLSARWRWQTATAAVHSARAAQRRTPAGVGVAGAAEAAMRQTGSSAGSDRAVR